MAKPSKRAKRALERKFPQYKNVPTASLHGYANNPRTHTEAQVAQIVRSIQEFGFTNPVLIDANGGVIAGHGRLLAAQSMGIASVPAIELSHLTKAQARAYVIADNRPWHAASGARIGNVA